MCGGRSGTAARGAGTRRSAPHGRPPVRRLTSVDMGYPRRSEGERPGRGRERGPWAGPAGGGDAPRAETSRMWHVTLSVSGEEAPLRDIRRGLEQLAHDHPFMLAGRYANDHAEIRYWEEARDLHDAAAVALRLWGEHRASAKLPPWEIVGLEVIGRETYHRRVAEGCGPYPAVPVGVHPF
ncbi:MULTISPECIES: hypothetical protein [Streptomyces]|uniref:Uncharacterized protein n=1 Tax=Streptomyces desertarenae TaxID=2666184 RepID=A0ABW4PBT0_9ACTN